MMASRKYDSTVARIAGNLLAGNSDLYREEYHSVLSGLAVKLARAIVAEVERTEPAAPSAPSMLEALKAHDQYMRDGYRDPENDALHPLAAANWVLVRAAIKKAEG